jgi:hypothetical protein
LSARSLSSCVRLRLRGRAREPFSTRRDSWDCVHTLLSTQLPGGLKSSLLVLIHDTKSPDSLFFLQRRVSIILTSCQLLLQRRHDRTFHGRRSTSTRGLRISRIARHDKRAQTTNGQKQPHRRPSWSYSVSAGRRLQCFLSVQHQRPQTTSTACHSTKHEQGGHFDLSSGARDSGRETCICVSAGRRFRRAGDDHRGARHGAAPSPVPVRLPARTLTCGYRGS